MSVTEVLLTGVGTALVTILGEGIRRSLERRNLERVELKEEIHSLRNEISLLRNEVERWQKQFYRLLQIAATDDRDRLNEFIDEFSGEVKEQYETKCDFTGKS